jgi:outer membrane protein
MRQRISKYLLAAAAIAAFGLVAAPQVASAQAKVAVVDAQRLVTDSTAGKAALARLRQVQEQKVAEFKTKQEELDGLRRRISEGRLSLAEDKLAELEKELEDKGTAFRRFQEDAEREFKKQQEQAFADIEKKVAPIIEEIGREQGLSLIFNKFQSGLVYADEASDITDQVIQRFDAQSPAAAQP